MTPAEFKLALSKTFSVSQARTVLNRYSDWHDFDAEEKQLCETKMVQLMRRNNSVGSESHAAEKAIVYVLENV